MSSNLVPHSKAEIGTKVKQLLCIIKVDRSTSVHIPGNPEKLTPIQYDGLFFQVFAYHQSLLDQSIVPTAKTDN
jgi:hypothetical protein